MLIAYDGWGLGLEGWFTSMVVDQGLIQAAGGQVRLSKLFDLWSPQPWRFVAGPAVAVGVAWVSGIPAVNVTGRTHVTPTAGVGAEAGVRLAISRHVELALQLSGRWNFGVIATVDGVDRLVWSGPAIGAWLGAFWSFS